MADDDNLAPAVVSPDLARQVPYPVVRVTSAGEVHELDMEDRAYLEERFHPCDGARPWIKFEYKSKDGWGSIEGFLFRDKLPHGIVIHAEPVVRAPQKTAEEMIREYTERAGCLLVDNGDGTFTATAPPRPRPWWQFWKA